jgi:hypothetical protein
MVIKDWACDYCGKEYQDTPGRLALHCFMHEELSIMKIVCSKCVETVRKHFRKFEDNYKQSYVIGQCGSCRIVITGFSKRFAFHKSILAADKQTFFAINVCDDCAEQAKTLIEKIKWKF